MKHEEILSLPIQSKLIFDESELQDGDWVYTPDSVFTAGTKHNIFQFDSRINYSLHLGHEPKFYKLCSK